MYCKTCNDISLRPDTITSHFSPVKRHIRLTLSVLHRAGPEMKCLTDHVVWMVVSQAEPQGASYYDNKREERERLKTGQIEKSF